MSVTASVAAVPASPAYAGFLHGSPDSMDVLVRDEPAVAAIVARSCGAATRLVALEWNTDFQAIVVRPDAGMRRVRDLRDRRIGLPPMRLQSGDPRAHAFRGALAALESEGMYHRHVQWVDLPAAGITSLLDGTVDAAYVRGSNGAEAARAAGARVLFDIGAQRDAWVRAHTALLRTFSVEAALLRDYPQMIPQALARCGLRPQAHIGLDEAAVTALEGLKTFMLRWSFVREDFRTSAWIDRQPLELAGLLPRSTAAASCLPRA